MLFFKITTSRFLNSDASYFQKGQKAEKILRDRLTKAKIGDFNIIRINTDVSGDFDTLIEIFGGNWTPHHYNSSWHDLHMILVDMSKYFGKVAIATHSSSINY